MKKLLLCFFVVFFALSSITANDYKFYSDPQNGYSGYAMADYLGTTKKIDPSAFSKVWEGNLYQQGFIVMGYCKKMSKQENFLLWKALGEYDFRANEVYAVTIIQGNQSLTCTVEIKKDRKSCSWCGGTYWYWSWY